MLTERNIVLIAEDDTYTVEALRAILRNNGYQVLAADNGQWAWELLRHNAPKISLVVLDLKLPGVSGYEILKRARTDPKLSDVPIVIVTGELEPELPPFIPLLRKPVDVTTLLELVASECGTKPGKERSV